MPLILHLETATNVCSVSISKGDNIIALRESDIDKSHATLLTIFIREVLEESGNKASELNAVSVSKGPGSYTGLRIGVSTAKGIAYAANIPVIGIISLQSMVYGVLKKELLSSLSSGSEEIILCPMIDARRMEVYTAFYDINGRMIRNVDAEILDSSSYLSNLDKNKMLFFGNGSDKAREVIKHKNAIFIPEISPSARHMLIPSIAAYEKKQFENTAYFEPFYLKDFVATIPRKKVL